MSENLDNRILGRTSSCGLRLFRVLAWCVVFWCAVFWQAACAVGQMPPALVVAKPVQQREMSAGKTFVGSVTALRTSTVSSAVEGRVIEFKVNEGDSVKKGQTLAQLRIKGLEIQRDAAEAELKELEHTLPQERDQAAARMAAAKAMMDYTKDRLKRSQDLRERNVVSADELQEDMSAAKSAEQQYYEAKAAWVLVDKEIYREVKIQQAKAKVDLLKDDIAEHTIVAPFDGYVTREHTEVGQWLSKGDPVAEVVELGSVDVKVPVLETYVERLKVGSPVRVTMIAFPGQSWTGKVQLIVHQADIRSRSFPVKVRLKNQFDEGVPLFKPGMFARVTLSVGKQGEVLLVPKDSLVLRRRATVVYAVDPLPPGTGEADAAKSAPPKGKPAGPPQPAPNGIAREVPVELGASSGELIEVRGELTPKDRVVVDGNERLFPGRPLIVVGEKSSPKQ